MIEYAIPSRARAETLVAKTLPLLRRLGVSPSSIKVFVAPEELTTYRDLLAGEFGDWYGGIVVTEGALGVGPNRNAILDHYEPGTRVISVDDDMRDLVVRAGEKALVSMTAVEWGDLVEEAFAQCEAVASRIWGLYPVPNPFFMKPRLRYDLCYIAAGLYGFVVDNTPESPLRVSLEDKEDFERSLQCYVADGALVRYEYVSWRTEGYHGKGGMQADGLRTKERVRASTEELIRRFPGLVTLNDKKKSGWVEPRLRDRRAA